MAGLYITVYATYLNEHQLISEPVVSNMSSHTDINLQTFSCHFKNVLIGFHITRDVYYFSNPYDWKYNQDSDYEVNKDYGNVCEP